MKALKIAGLVVGAVALAATGIGLAAGFGIGAGIGAIGTGIGLSGIAASAFTVALAGAALYTLSAGVNLVEGLFPKPSTGGSQTKWKADPYAGLPYVMGRTLVSGNIVYRRGHGSSNKFETFVTILGICTAASIDTTFMNKTTVAFDGSGNATGTYKGQIYQRTQLGACPEPAALVPPIDTPPGWTSAHKLSGLSAVMNTFVYDSKETNGLTAEPAPGWIGHWVKVYDPRLDSTYPGGSGPCRAYQEETYVWSENPHLHALTWCLGRYQNGKRVAGIGASRFVDRAKITGVDVASFVEGANLDDARGWTIGGQVVTRPDTLWNSLKLMLQAGGAQPALIGGVITSINRAPRVSLATINRDDIVGKCNFAGTQRRRTRINGVIPSYRSEAHDWEIVAGDIVQVPDFVTLDGDERTQDVTYQLVQDVHQASQLAIYDIYDAREAGPGTIPLKPWWLNYKVGDCVTFEPEDDLSIKVLITGRAIEAQSGVVTYTVTGETDGKHAYALGQTGVAPPIASLVYDPSVPAPGADEWTLAGGVISDNGTTLPILSLTGAVGIPSADAVVFDFRPYVSTQGDSAGWRGVSIDSPTTTHKEFAGVTPGSQYQVGVRYRMRGIVGDRLMLGPVTAGTIELPWHNVGGDGKPEDNATVGAPAGTHVGNKLAEDVVQALEVNAQDIESLGLTLDQTKKVLDAAAFVNGQPVSAEFDTFRNDQKTTNTALESVATLLGAKSPDGTAFNLNMDTVYTGPDKTIGQHFEDIEGVNSKNAASVKTLNEVVLGNDGSAVARALIRADVNGNFAGIVVIASDGSIQEISEIGLIAGVTKIAGQDGTLLAEFKEEGGFAYIPNLLVDNLRIGTGGSTGQPSVVTGSSRINLSGTPTTILSIPVIAARRAKIYASTGINLTFDGNANWNQQILINGQRVFGNKGGQIEHGPSMIGALEVAGGDTYLVEFQVWGDGSVYVTDRTLFAVAYYEPDA